MWSFKFEEFPYLLGAATVGGSGPSYKSNFFKLLSAAFLTYLSIQSLITDFVQLMQLMKLNYFIALQCISVFSLLLPCLLSL